MPDTFTTLTESEFDQRIIENEAGVRVSVLANGCLQWIMVGPTMINLFVGSPLVGGAMRLHLRRFSDNGLGLADACIQVIGPASASELKSDESGFAWTGVWLGMTYRVELVLHEEEAAWQWRLSLDGDKSEGWFYSCVLMQDVGIASRGQIQNNEAYTSQYIDQHGETHPEVGPVAMARQNLAQHEKHPWLIHTCATGGQAVTTDAFEFFDAGSRDVESSLARMKFDTSLRQYECSAHVLASAAEKLNSKGHAEWRFVARFVEDHPALSSAADLLRVDGLLDPEAFGKVGPNATRFGDRPADWLAGEPWSSMEELEQEDIEREWPERRNEEWFDIGLASFFYGDGRHVVLWEKEMEVERRTAHLLVAGNDRLPGGETLCSTGYASGPIASHICLGNTSFNKLASVSRDPLNLIRSDGIRLFVRLDDQQAWRPVGSASAFDMGRDDCRWHYRLQDGPAFTITATAEHDRPSLSYTLESPDSPLQVLLLMHLALGDREHEHPGTVAVDGQTATLTPGSDTMIRQAYPDVSWTMNFGEGTASLGGDELLYYDGKRRGLPYLVAISESVTSWGWSVSGQLGAEAKDRSALSERITANTGTNSPSMVLAESPGVSQLNEALPWFDHNAAIHLTAPHGIEQYGGAAWGVRDVCQGPLEWLLARGEPETVARILEDVFSHQYEHSGAWPQWYMHPPFENIQSPHSHGDVAVWPVIAVVNYLAATGDVALLDKAVPFTQSEPPFVLTDTMATIREHVEFAIKKLVEKFVPGTALLAYGDGDWNDSLQPARPEMRESMVSTWTVELFYQALRSWAEAMRRVGDEAAATKHDATADAIRDDFNQRLVLDDETVGLYLHHEDPVQAKVLLHPRDTDTGVKHRLLPMIRGIISGIFTPEQAKHHAALIQKHLLAPDGARLMDRPPKYTGGTMTHFQRLESASFFGREIGLMYTHAHLRYAEAMAKLGEADLLFEALQKINPVGIQHAVPNASPRQANCYFSSSDAAFLNRADSEERYDELMQGNVPVNGGWRVYSSGPGIAIGLIVRQWLGLRRDYDRLVFDPVLSAEHDGLVATVSLLGESCEVTYHVSGEAQGVQRVALDGEAVDAVGRAANPYRVGGLCVDVESFRERLESSQKRIEVWC